MHNVSDNGDISLNFTNLKPIHSSEGNASSRFLCPPREHQSIFQTW